MFLSTRAAVAAALAGVVAALLPGPSAPWAWGGLALVLVAAGLDVVLAPGPASIGLQRELPTSTTVGTDVEVVLRITNPLESRSLRVWVHDAVRPSMQPRPRDHAVVVAPTSTVRVTSSCRPTRRGDQPFGPVTVRAAGPLGLAGRQGRVEVPGSLRVYPDLPGRRQVELRAERARLLATGLRVARLRGRGTEFDSLRDYHPDDEYRTINWRATARSQRPVVNVHREERNQHVLVLLDASRTMAGTIDGVSRYELAIDGALAVAGLAAHAGDHVGAMAFDDRVLALIGPRSGGQQAHRVLDVLFAIEPSLQAPAYKTAFAHLLARHRRRALLMLLTDLTDHRAMESLFTALPTLTRRHVVVVGAVRDPKLDAAPVLHDTADAHHAAATAAAVGTRSDTARRLRSLGATVVDLPPDRWAGGLADAYLHVKSTGRL